MKILLINSYFEKGGAEIVFMDSFHGLQKYSSDFECVIAASGFSSEKNSFSLDSWENHRIFAPLYYIFNIKNIFILWGLLQKFKPDIIHLHGFLGALSPSILFVIRLWKKLYAVKVVQTVHDYHIICPNSSAYNYNKKEKCLKCLGKKVKLNICFYNCDRRGWIYSLMKGFRSFVANNVANHQKIIDLFITPSIFLREQMLKEGIHEDKLLVLRNPLDFQEYPKFHKKNILVYFGRFSKEKNLAFLLEVFHNFFNNHPLNPKLLLIGHGEEEENLKMFVANHHLEEKISFLPFQTKEKLQDIIAEAKVMVLPSSVYETYGLVIFEAIVQDIYPITSANGGLKESIDWAGIGKTFEDGSDIQLKEIIEEALIQHGMCDFNMAQKKIKENLELQSYCLELEKMYKKLIENNDI